MRPRRVSTAPYLNFVASFTTCAHHVPIGRVGSGSFRELWAPGYSEVCDSMLVNGPHFVHEVIQWRHHSDQAGAGRFAGTGFVDPRMS